MVIVFSKKIVKTEIAASMKVANELIIGENDSSPDENSDAALLERIRLLEKKLESKLKKDAPEQPAEPETKREVACIPSCANGGVCKNGTCLCPTGYTGRDCSDKVCSPACKNNGICIAGTCKCTDYYEGPSCEIAKCSTPCKNGGTCEDPLRNTCNCTQGWSGSLCDRPICKEPVYCKNGGKCLGWDKCECPVAYRSRDNPQCIQSNCLHECINGGICILNSTTMAFECSCKPGFSGSRCEKENICSMPQDKGICKIFLEEPLALAEANALSWKGTEVSNKYCIDYLKYVMANIHSKFGIITYTQCTEYCNSYETNRICDRIWKPEDLKLSCEGQTRYHFANGKCTQFKYLGGLGTKNNFPDDKACMHSCGSTTPTIGASTAPILKPFKDTCYVWGRGHYSTFDGRQYEFNGGCSYVLLHDTEPTSSFRIIVINDPKANYNSTVKRKLKLTIDSKEIYLGQKIGNTFTVMVEKKPVTLPYEGNPKIRQAGRYVLVITQENGIVYWDGKEDVMIKVPSSFKTAPGSNHRLYGLCGTFDGNKDNDLQGIGSSAVYTDVKEFAKLWSYDSACAESTTAIATYAPRGQTDALANAERMCSAILTDAFAACHAKIPVQGYQTMCMKDVLKCNYNLRSDCVCNAFSLYARACQKIANVTLSWRSASLCPISCPGNMVYQECGSACPKSCSNMLSSHTSCVSDCVDGCHCPSDLWQDGEQCKPRSHCSCYVNGVAYAHNSIKKTACEECECKSGLWSCKKLPCSGTCTIAGDPHITTYDGKTYSMYGKCAYTLTEHCHYNNATGKVFEVIVKNSNCQESNGFATCARMLIVKLLKIKVDILLTSTKLSTGQYMPSVSVGGRDENWAKTKDYMIERIGKENVIVSLSVGLRVQWTGRNAYLTVSPSFENKTCGLCGTFNHNSQDDYHTRTGSTEASVKSFTNHWVYKDASINQAPTCNSWDEEISACSIFTSRESSAKTQCSVIKDTTGPFKLCHSVIPPESFYKMCLEDGCKCESCLCDVISSYAKMCMDKSISVGDWRPKTTTCQAMLQCSGKKVRKQCNRNSSGHLKCPQTCRDLTLNDTSSCIKRGCIEGCYCPDGYYENDQQECVEQKQCPCYHNNMMYSYGNVRKDKCNNCTCVGGVFQCTNVNCETFCKAKGLVYSDCGLTCSNMQDDTSVCEPGCFCPDGFALHENGTCVDPEAGCQCVEGGEFYNAGDISPSDCSRKCTGMRVWEQIPNTEAKPQYDCAAFGELHYRTFDGKMFKFDGQMVEYVLLTDCFIAPGKMCDMSKAAINIRVKNVRCEQSYDQYMCKQVTVETKTGKAIMRQKEVKLTVDGTTKTFTEGSYPQPLTNVGGGFEVFKLGVFIVVRVYSLGYTVKFDQSSRVYVVPPKSYKGKGYLAGLCGDYNGKDDDDFKKPDLSMADNALAFANAWGDQSGSATDKDSCSTNPYRKPWAQKGCNVIKSANFTACHKAIAPGPFIEACQQETCLCKFGGDCACFCAAVGAYVQECNRVGIPIYWRREGLCSKYSVHL
eukprot:gene13727-4647_t